MPASGGWPGVSEGLPDLQSKGSTHARSVSGLEPTGFGAHKLSLPPAGLVMLSLDISRQGYS